MSKIKYPIFILITLFTLTFLPSSISYAQSTNFPCDDNSEACSVDYVNDFTLPKALAQEKVEITNIQQVLSGIKDKLGEIFWSIPTKLGTLYLNSQNIYSTKVPGSLVPQGQEYFDNLQMMLGHKGSPQTGYYTLGDPEYSDLDKAAAKQFETTFEHSRLPANVCPITGQCSK